MACNWRPVREVIFARAAGKIAAWSLGSARIAVWMLPHSTRIRNEFHRPETRNYSGYQIPEAEPKRHSDRQIRSWPLKLAQAHFQASHRNLAIPDKYCCNPPNLLALTFY
jgi:hypothetical protein